jgi:oxygen-independent coproporphyrinogen-3 oxidase
MICGVDLAIPITANAIRPAELAAVHVSGLYVHLPFCFHKCHYCDFYSITRQGPERMGRFVDRVLAEAELWARGNGPQIKPRTVFFGGGTPSLLPLAEMDRLLAGLRKRFDMSEIAEWTVEVNPATASFEYLKMLRLHRVDRISMGAQSFDRSELSMLERHHEPDDVPRSIEMAREAGFQRLNIDLIYAIPGQTLESWSASLERAIALGLTHYSCYGLTYEPNTPLAVKKRLGTLKAAEEDLELSMLRHARKRLTEIGRPPYEISNYAAAGQECRHNLLYWTGGDYVGLGPSAASHIQGTRFKNRPHLGEWEQSIDRGELPAAEVEHLTPLQRAGERVMLGLRLSEGLKFDDYAAQTGFDARSLFEDQLRRLKKFGLLQVNDSGFLLTDAGLAVADTIAAQFLTPIS